MHDEYGPIPGLLLFLAVGLLVFVIGGWWWQALIVYAAIPALAVIAWLLVELYALVSPTCRQRRRAEHEAERRRWQELRRAYPFLGRESNS